jgi:hypothetical protein
MSLITGKDILDQLEWKPPSDPHCEITYKCQVCGATSRFPRPNGLYWRTNDAVVDVMASTSRAKIASNGFGRSKIIIEIDVLEGETPEKTLKDYISFYRLLTMESVKRYVCAVFRQHKWKAEPLTIDVPVISKEG